MAAKKKAEPARKSAAARKAGKISTETRKKSPKSSGAARPALAPARASKSGAKDRTTARKGPLMAPALVLPTYRKLRERYPDAHCELDHQSAFQLILATVLSAQSTDVMVNKITPELFRRWPTPTALAAADPDDVEKALNKIGMYRQKTKNIVGLAKKLLSDYGGEVPRTLAELVLLPGVGRKTANVVLGVAFGAPEGVVVDTHVQRISQRLGWTRQTEPPEIEGDLMALFPKSEWDMLSHTLIFHGRRTCSARKPACAACPVNGECPSAFHAEEIGRKNPRLRMPATVAKKRSK
jgi:endonuclease-3